MTVERIGGKKTQIQSCQTPKKNFFTLAHNVFHRVLTLLEVLLLWVLFRNGTKESIKIILKMFGINYTQFWGKAREFVPNSFLLLNIDPKFFILAGIGILFSFPWWKKIAFLYTKNATVSTILMAIKYLSLGCLLLLCCANLADNSYNPFIYFRF